MVSTHASIRRWVELIEAEFREMPNLHLTKAQVQRFWALDAVTCDLLLEELECGQVVRRTLKAAYVRSDLGA